MTKLPVFAALLCGLLLHGPALAEPVGEAYPPPPTDTMWRREWPTFGLVEAVATVTAGVGTGVLFMIKPPEEARWEGGVLFDDAIRDGMRLESAAARKSVRGLGDLPYYAAPILPLLVDPLLVAWLIRGDTKTAANLELMGLEGFAYAGLLSFVSTRISLRERPDSSECRRTQAQTGASCEVDTEAFISGHTSIVAASAGLVCANHRYLPLWGHPVADAGACVLATTGALWTGVSRIMADRHYTTDVLAGFLVGFGVGYSVPAFLHYTRRTGDVALALRPSSVCASCLELTGSF